MQIHFPRKIRLGFRPVYGLTVRQLLYVAAFGTVGGLVILAGSFQGASLIVRAAVGLVLIVVGLTLAFLRISGLALDEWLPIALRYLLRPRRRVWRKRQVARPVVTNQSQSPSPQSTPRPWRQSSVRPLMPAANTVAARAMPSRATVIVFIDLFILLVLAALTIYLRERGLYEVQLTLAQHLTR